MKIFENLLKIFSDECNYESINKYNSIKLRNRKDGIRLTDAIYYRFLYTKIATTKEEITSNINTINNTNFSRQAYEYKESNIPIRFYYVIFNKICLLFDKFINPNNDKIIVGIDGTYNNNNKKDEILNMGFFNITNSLPIDLKSYGPNGKNREIQSATNYLKDNLDKFRNVIIVADRAYFSYDFLDFLDNHNISFIIRTRGSALNLDTNNPLKKSVPSYDKIISLRKSVRIIKYEHSFKKTIYAGKSKRLINKHVITVKNNCTLVTNIKNRRKFSNKKLLDIYKSRWDIETFFKYIKNNYKFQIMREKDKGQYEKMYVCELIISYIVKIVEHYYMNIKKDGNKINLTNLTKGILQYLLYDMLNGTLTIDGLNKFCKRYIVKIKNNKNRTFPRNSKTPFTKWYVKGYSDMTKYNKIINAIKSRTIDKLNKNLKTLAKRITIIDNKENG